jgi:hypothetical protein
VLAAGAAAVAVESAISNYRWRQVSEEIGKEGKNGIVSLRFAADFFASGRFEG